MHQARRALQFDVGRMHADHLASDAAQLRPLGAGAQAAAVDHAGVWSGCEVVGRAGAVPVQRHPGVGFQRRAQRIQQAAVVELAFGGQPPAAHEAPGQRGLQGRECRRIKRLHRRQAVHGGLRAAQRAGQALGLGRVLPVPDDEGACLLEEHRSRQQGQ